MSMSYVDCLGCHVHSDDDSEHEDGCAFDQRVKYRARCVDCDRPIRVSAPWKDHICGPCANAWGSLGMVADR